MGGDDAPINIAYLTPEEHFVAHQLLARIFPGLPGLIRALGRMNARRYRRNKEYGWIRRRYAQLLIGNQYGKGQIAWNKGKPMPAHVRAILDALLPEKFRGAGNPAAKLTDADVMRIREMAAAGMTQAHIASLFRIQQSAVSRVVTGARWAHLSTSAETRKQLEETSAKARRRMAERRMKLTDQDIRRIRAALASGTAKAVDLAQRYGVSTVQIYRIGNGTRR